MFRRATHWSRRWLLLVAFVLVFPLGRAVAQEAEGEEAAAPAPMAEEAPLDPGPDLTVLPDIPSPRPADVSPSAVTGAGNLDPNAPSGEDQTSPQGGEGNGGD